MTEKLCKCETACIWCGRPVSRELVSTVYLGRHVFHGSCYEVAEKMGRMARGEEE